jgi:hypothetical protein
MVTDEGANTATIAAGGGGDAKKPVKSSQYDRRAQDPTLSGASPLRGLKFKLFC